MSDFTDILARATRRLKIDRQLQLEVQRELRGHLDDAEREYLDAGRPPEEARDLAARALGDPDALADQLWRANRARVRLRFWAWWAARVALLPAVALAIIWFVISDAAALQQYTMAQHGGGFLGGNTFADWAENRLKASMTPEQRLIFFGDDTHVPRGTNRPERWRPLRDAFPNDPLYQTHYVSMLLSYSTQAKTGTRDLIEANDPDTIASLRRELDRARQLEPDNGFYDLIDAWLLFQQAGKIDQDESRSIVFVADDAAKRDPSHPMAFTGHIDDAKLAEAFASFHAAASKPYITDHAMDMLRRRIDQLPPAHSMREYLYRIGNAIGVLLPALGHYRVVARYTEAEAIRLAEAGDVDGALALLDELDTLNAKIAAGSDTVIHLLVARSIHQLVLQAHAWVYTVSSRPADADAAKEAWRADQAQFREMWHKPLEDAKANTGRGARAGVLISAIMPALPGYDIDPTPFRLSEYLLLDRGVLTALLAVLVLLAAAAGGATVLSLRKPRDARPILLWIGWKRLALVLACGAAAPLLAFVLLTRSPLGGRDLGLNASTTPLFFYAPSAIATLGTLWLTGSHMLRSRAKDLGLPVPPPRTGRTLAGSIGALAFAVLLAFVAPRIIGSMVRGTGDVEIAFFLTLLAIAAVPWPFVVHEITWLRGLSVRRAVAGAFWRTALIAAIFVTLGLAAIDPTAPSPDRAFFLTIIVTLACFAGGALGLLWLAHRPSDTALFAWSAVRSTGPILLAAAALLLATAGPLLQWRERTLVHQIAAQSPIWMDLEVERSNARLLKAALAQGQPAPPRVP